MMLLVVAYALQVSLRAQVTIAGNAKGASARQTAKDSTRSSVWQLLSRRWCSWLLWLSRRLGSRRLLRGRWRLGDGNVRVSNITTTLRVVVGSTITCEASFVLNNAIFAGGNFHKILFGNALAGLNQAQALANGTS